MKDISWFASICANNGLKLSDEQAASFENYFKLLLSWNSKVNLISRKDENNFYPHHALNCVSFLFSHRLNLNSKILDLGTGGGLPGIPLRIIHDDLNLSLLDSIAKKTAVLSDIVIQMRLEKVEVLTGRAENLAKTDEFNRKFDYVITRAAGKLDEVIKWARGFLVRPSVGTPTKSPENFELPGRSTIPVGSLIVLKGGTIADELRLARNLKYVEAVDVNDIEFSGMDELENNDKKLILVKYRTTEKEN